ncbi:PIG-L family deacetylase [Streptacidiphilus sp. EB129]|uniref:PIG-L family deacetylase n=1 Tax=Streptacidiphilus sp. EB129 TaxID=3156262 RepID=UPI003516922D
MGLLSRSASTTHQAAATSRAAADRTVLHICAHTDDDLYFMSPDLLHAVRSGARIVSVYLTAGEADGRNIPTNQADRLSRPQDFEGYARGRQWGIRTAYAAAAGCPEPADQPWRDETFKAGDGLIGEISTLDRAGGITLVFLNLRMSEADGVPLVLRTLWNGEADSVVALCPTHSVIPEGSGSGRITREGLLGTLVELLDSHRPTTVRILDPDPWHTSYDAGTTTAQYCDHQDHTASALFALEALRRYNAAGHDVPVQVQSYVGYGNKLWPDNLSASAAAEKFAHIDIYGGTGQDLHPDHMYRGDRQLGNRAYNRWYGQSTTHRWLGSTTWLQAEHGGGLVAFGVRNGIPVRWTGTADGGSWSEPKPLGQWPLEEMGECLPHLEAVRDVSGRLHAVGVSTRLGPKPEDHVRCVMAISQSTVGGGFGAWEKLGGPNPTPAVKLREIGMPQAIATAGSGVRFVVRNFGTGLSSRARDTHGWGPWEDLGGGSQEGAGLITTSRGELEIYANTKVGILRWSQPAQGHPFRQDYATLINKSSAPLALVEQPDGRLAMFARQPGTGWIVGYRQRKAKGTWNPQPEFLGGVGGYGRIVTVLSPDGDSVVLVTGNGAGGLSVSRQSLTGAPWSPDWQDIGGVPYVHAPSATLDESGRLVVAVQGIDTHLHLRTARFRRNGELAFGPWWTATR